MGRSVFKRDYLSLYLPLSLSSAQDLSLSLFLSRSSSVSLLHYYIYIYIFVLSKLSLSLSTTLLSTRRSLLSRSLFLYKAYQKTKYTEKVFIIIIAIATY